MIACQNQIISVKMDILLMTDQNLEAIVFIIKLKKDVTWKVLVDQDKKIELERRNLNKKEGLLKN